MLANVLLDFFKEEVYCLAFAIAKDLELLEEAVDVLWWRHLNGVLLALTQEINQLTLGVLALLNLLSVGQVVRRLVLVEINKVRVSDVSELIHDALRIIFLHRQLVQLHNLGSTSEQKKNKYSDNYSVA